MHFPLDLLDFYIRFVQNLDLCLSLLIMYISFKIKCIFLQMHPQFLTFTFYVFFSFLILYVYSLRCWRSERVQPRIFHFSQMPAGTQPLILVKKEWWYLLITKQTTPTIIIVYRPGHCLFSDFLSGEECTFIRRKKIWTAYKCVPLYSHRMLKV